ncbi:MAG: hypothetical protein ABSA05_04650 [Opitutaceae bacterium]|jgi:hypothetical protein
MRIPKPIGSRVRLNAVPVICGLIAMLAASQASGQAGAGAPPQMPAARPQPPPVYLFYSPIAPALGAAVSPGAPTFSTGPAAPASLAAYVNEPFYALLATRLVRSGLSGDISSRLDHYETEKAALLAELRAHLDIVRNLDPDVRERELQAFAREQTPRISALEAAAEEIRRVLCNNPESSTDYFRWRLAHAGADNSSERSRSLAVLSCLKADVYYREGLSPAQRRLLGELVQDYTDSLDGNSPPKDRFFRFSPDTSAILFRDDLPKDVYASLLAYRSEKSALKQALLRALFPEKQNPNDPYGAASLRALASAQAPLFAALEERAEDIRSKLAPLGDPDRLPEMPAIPADFEARITAYRGEKLALQKALLARVEEVKKNGSSADAAAVSESTRQAIAAFTGENAARYAALAKMRESIRTDLSKMEAGNAAPVSSDAMVAQFSDSLRKLETYWDYRDYRNAVLQPGLSPEQRRLLFDGALQKLALPLPKGELLFEPG